MLAIVVFSPIYAVVALLVRIKLGKPVLFKQPRPGMFDEDGNETVFNMYKFRSMTDERGEDGELLPDEKRLGKFGKLLRSISLDELPGAFKFLKGEMSVLGPRPQLVRDLVFMDDRQRLRHTARPGMTGLAQVRGRNAITWEEKIEWDLKYIENVTFLNDLKIVIQTVLVAFVHKSGITDGENATALDYGDALLKDGRVTMEEYEQKQAQAKKMIANHK